MNSLDRHWHLAHDEVATNVSEFELQLWRVFYGFVRWQEECERAINGTDLTGNELAILHIIRMKERPKTVYDIGRILNRNDTYNIIYSIRKLLKIGLIEKTNYSDYNQHKNTIAYQVTAEGIQRTNAYTEVRRDVLINMLQSEKDLNLEELSRILAKINAIYNEADRTVSSYARRIREPITKSKKNIQRAIK